MYLCCELGGSWADELYPLAYDTGRDLFFIYFWEPFQWDKFDSLLVDYVHPRKFPKLGPTLTWVLRATTVGVLVGVYQFNTEDIGPCIRSYLPPHKRC